MGLRELRIISWVQKMGASPIKHLENCIGCESNSDMKCILAEQCFTLDERLSPYTPLQLRHRQIITEASDIKSEAV